jgi:hypothetical protein
MKKIIPSAVTFAALLIATSCLANDSLSLLDSLLARGLIDSSDYQEQRQLLVQSTKNQSELSATHTAITKVIDASEISAANNISLLQSEQIILASNDQTTNDHKNGKAHSEHNENHFAGPYIVLTNEWKRSSVKVDGEKISKSEAAPSFGLGYTFALNSSYTLGLKISGDFKSGEYGAGDVAGTETKVVEKNHYSVAVEPGYVVNPKLLVFGILAHHTAIAEIEGVSGHARMNGIGYGIGFKQTVADHLFIMAELQRIDYGRETIDVSTIKPSSTVGAVGLGYHF